jgi:outer membrane receptor for monomeric catechols
VPEMLNYGFSVTKRPVTLMAQATYRGESQGAPVANMGSNAYFFRQARTSIDVNLDYQFRRGLSFFTNVRNVLNEYFTDRVYGPETPAYAVHRRHNNNGVQFAIGVKGSF